ncbi:hypothetical protein PVAP13_4NG172100 [Panicum virgatum]|uniref:Uncharacterized protein n=1 Tax=Panicum virgatum TaxID=38727 RepID=A0A8T0T842_PANVG|nr:hypothetical protein PVAP13_4NG172100 [Panicum virgatum]
MHFMVLGFDQRRAMNLRRTHEEPRLGEDGLDSCALGAKIRSDEGQEPVTSRSPVAEGAHISFWLILFGFIPLHQILLKLQETELQNDHMNLRTKIEEGEQQLQQVTVARSAATQVQS